jgi:hypothetical protein
VQGEGVVIARAQFSDPSDVKVSVMLSGTLKEFEALSGEMLDKLPFYQARPLIEAVQEATQRLRASVEGGSKEDEA